MLRGDVALVFVLGAEGGGAAVAGEGADERTGVRREDVFVESGDGWVGLPAGATTFLVLIGT